MPRGRPETVLTPSPQIIGSMQILRRTNQEDIAKLVEGRLTVISAQNGSSSSSSSSSVDSDREGSDDGDEAEGRRDAVDSSDHGNNMGPRSEPRPAQPIKASAAQVLRDLANGVRPVRKPPRLLSKVQSPRAPSASLSASFIAA